MAQSEVETRLPIPLSSFIGRQDEIQSLLQILSSGARLITLTGVGGVGKTRLALELAAQVASDFENGVLFVPLEALTEAEQVVWALSRAAGVSESGERPVFEDLRAHLAEKHTLVCLDNCEHVLQAASQIADLLIACPRLHILATSREGLRLRGEREFPLSPLSVPAPGDQAQSPAVQLFAERAKAVNPGFEINERNAPTVTAICALLDGLPLAIELAAALLRIFSPQALLKRLQSSPGFEGRSPSMQLLVGGARDLPMRQQTLHATMSWSYNLLDNYEKRLFRWMSVFSGGCDLDAAQEVCAHDEDGSRPVLDILISLVEKNLLQAVKTGGEPRFRWLRTIQEFAMDQLQNSGDLPEARRRHAACFVELAERAKQEFGGPEQGAWFDRLEMELNNLRTALGWTLGQEDQLEIAYRLGGALWYLWAARGNRNEGRQWLDRILTKEGDIPILLKANAVNGAGGLALLQGDYEVAQKHYSESLALRRFIGDKPGIAASLQNLAQLAINQNDFDTALSYVDESLVLNREIGDQAEIASCLLFIGLILVRQKIFKSAEDHVQQALAISEELGDLWQVAFSHSLLGDIAYGQKRYEQARQRFSVAKSMFTEFGELGHVSDTDYSLGLIAIHQGDFPEAEKLFVESLNRKHELAERLGVAYALEGLAYLAAASIKPQKAARLWGAAEAIRESIGTPLTDLEQADSERYITAARAQLREKAFQAEKETGATMSLEQIFQYALEPSEESSLDAGKKTTRRSYPAGLTAREVEVLGLVAQGLSDAEVSESLVISPRTVNAHLTSIYNKLGVNSRVAATRFAVDHGLVEQ